YADSRPLVENLTPEQRAKNRRVEVVILEHAPVRPEQQDNAFPSAPLDDIPTELQSPGSSSTPSTN
ncbi:MAG: hypothetical protein Q8N04_04540, partial [Nitrospira sp.]|nr:hypothetical protein [Nitrospira sp.]